MKIWKSIFQYDLNRFLAVQCSEVRHLLSQSLYINCHVCHTRWVIILKYTHTEMFLVRSGQISQSWVHGTINSHRLQKTPSNPLSCLLKAYADKIVTQIARPALGIKPTATHKQPLEPTIAQRQRSYSVALGANYVIAVDLWEIFIFIRHVGKVQQDPGMLVKYNKTLACW